MNIFSLFNRLRSCLVAVSLLFVPLSLKAATTHTVTNTLDSGTGSLRTVISNAAAGDTIVFNIPTTDAGYDASTNFFTITLTSGRILISQNLIINGPPAANIAISGNHSSSVFTINPATVEISNISIINGFARGMDGEQFFPAQSGNGGGIYDNGGHLSLINCSITGNSVVGGNAGMNSDPFGNIGGSGAGGGIYITSGTMLMVGCTVSGNSAEAGLASDAGFGGGAGGQAQGGGIYNSFDSTVTLLNCTVTNNSISAGAGAGSAIGNGNGGLALGGGIRNAGSLTSQYTTIAGNVASGGRGGSNSAAAAGNGGDASGGGIHSGDFFGSPTDFRGSIIAENNVMGGAPGTGSSPGSAGAETAPDSNGFTSQGHNLLGRWDGSGGFTSTDLIGGATDATKIDPLLGPLDFNGGPTQTRALQTGSPAIDTADFNAPARDQRNFLRAGIPDIGAYEYRGTRPVALANISSRLNVGTGNNVLIGGFIITGKHNKPVLLRAIGPSLTLPGALSNPLLELHDHTGALIAHNDDWQDAGNHVDISTTGLAPTNALESAILVNLAPGAYTAIVSGVNNAIGTGLVELYDLDSMVDSKLGNISARGLVQTDNDVLIAGFIVVGPDSQKIIFRAIGPSLPLADKLIDPTLELHDSNGALIASNDNWKDTQQAQIEATGIAPTNNAESAIVSTLLPGPYTAIVRGKNNTTGIAVVEGYDLN
jgi:hypothetical protein